MLFELGNLAGCELSRASLAHAFTTGGCSCGISRQEEVESNTSTALKASVAAKSDNQELVPGTLVEYQPAGDARWS